MAINPMQRRARNSFIQGALAALVIMLIVVLVLVKRIKALNDTKEALEIANSEVYVTAIDLKSGEELDFEKDFVLETVRTNVDPEKIISAEDWEYVDKEGMPETEYDENGNPIPQKVKVTIKIDVPAGTIVTKDMVYKDGNNTPKSERIQEYNMIVLPSKLKVGDYVDIRLTMPTGQDYIVLAKKEVINATDTGLWIKVTEDEILTMNNAIVESYILPGTKLYAIQYTEAGMQEEAIATYQVGIDVKNLIDRDPNVTEEARKKLSAIYNNELRTYYFDVPLNVYVQSQEDRDSSVQSGVLQEVQKVQEARAAFLQEITEDSEEVEE